MNVDCSLCGESCSADEAKHMPLYCSGSEGIVVCLECRMVLTEVARSMRRVAGKVRIAATRAAHTRAQVTPC